MKVVKFKNYKTFAEELKTKTGCDNINIKLMNSKTVNDLIKEVYRNV